MTFPGRLLLSALGLTSETTRRESARSLEIRRAAMSEAAQADEIRFAQAMEVRARMPNITFGLVGSGGTYRLTLDDYLGAGMEVIAGTGGGKSRVICSQVDDVDGRALVGEAVNVVWVDGKGEGADLRLRALAHRIESHPRASWPELARRIYTFSFFHPEWLPAWALFAPQRGHSPMEVATSVAEVLDEVLAASSQGVHQRATVPAVLALDIEHGIPPVSLPWLLLSPKRVAELAARSTQLEVRRELRRFAQVAADRSTVPGLLARLAVLFRVPSFKAVISSGSAFNFARCLEPGTFTTINFGGVPLNRRAGVKALGSIIIRLLLDAIYDPRRSHRGQTLVVIDEPQLLLTPGTIAALEDALALGRSFGVNVAVLHQTVQQLGPELRALLTGNVAVTCLGRIAAADASALSEWFPRSLPPGHRASTSRPPSAEQIRAAWIEVLGQLPRQHFLVSDRRSRPTFEPRVVVAPTFAPPPWDAINPEVRELVLRGAIGRPRSALEARVAAIEAQAAADFEEEMAEGHVPTSRRGSRHPTTPAAPAPRSRKGGLP